MDRKKLVYLIFLASITCFFSLDSCTNQQMNTNYPESASYLWNLPTYIPINTWTNLADTDQYYYNYIACLYPVLVELNISTCNNYIDFYVYNDEDYQHQLFYRKFTNIINSPIFIQNEESFYYLKTLGGLSGCGSMVPSEIMVRRADSAIVYNYNYTQTIDHINYTLFQADLERGVRYKVNFTRTDPLTDIQFSFLYASEGSVTRDYENITLYNNGEFTATKDVKALLILKSYQPNSHLFSFQVSEIGRTLSYYFNPEVIMILILAVAGTCIAIIHIVRSRRRSK